MKYYFKTTRSFIVISLLSLIVLLVACEKTAQDKMPITTTSEKALEYYLEGLELSDKLRGQEAIYFYLKALAEDPDFALGYVQMAFAQTTVQGIFKYFEKAKALIENVSEGERLWIMAIEAGFNGDPMQQREYIKNIVQLYPNDERAHNLLANQYFGFQEYELAIPHYERAIEIDPDYSQPYNQLGYSYRFLGKYEEARSVFNTYIDLIPEDPNPYDSFAELLLITGEHDESIEYYNKALNQKQTFIPSYIGIATNLNIMGQHAAAREHLNEALDVAETFGQERQIYQSIIISYIDEMDTVNAFTTIEHLITIDKERDDPVSLANDYNNKANLLLFIAGESDKALKFYEKSVDIINATDLSQEIKYNAKWGLMGTAGQVYVIKGDYDVAHKYIEKFSHYAEKAENPFQIMFSHQLKGLLALYTSSYEEAITEFENANQQNPVIHFWTAQAYENLGDNEVAQEYYRRAAYANSLNNVNYAFIRQTAVSRITD